MSYEGYTQYLCCNGHYDIVDCYDDYYSFDEWECPTCKGAKAWHNVVDLTNGSWDENGNRIDRYVDLKVKYEADVCECHCGHKHEISPRIYEIPRRK